MLTNSVKFDTCFRQMNIFLGLFTLLIAQAAFSQDFLDDGSEVISGYELKSEKFFYSKPEDVFRAKVVAVINKSNIGSTAQTMHLYVDGILASVWKVSTGREKLEIAKSGRQYVTTTPVGYFRPTRLVPNHRSLTWQADMPFAVFFNGGIAAHATTLVDRLGTRASGGCVRNTIEGAKLFYGLIENTGKKLVPQIQRNGSTLKKGDGTPAMQVNYDVLIIVENRV